MNKQQSRTAGGLFRLLFINALWLPIILLVVFLDARRPELSKPEHRAAPKQLLQFTSGGHILGFSSHGVYIAGGSHALHMEFVNSRETIPASDATPGDEGAPDKEQRPTALSRVAYANLWDGVTLTYDAPGNAVARSTYRVEPHANPGNIRLRYNAPIAVQNNGSLRVSFNTGTLNETAPEAWQERDGERMPVRVAFAPRENGELTFALGEYDPNQPLFIDPAITWNTFLGGPAVDEAFSLAVDASGNFYVAGFSFAAWGSPVQPYDGGGVDGFAAKLDSNGNLIWNTFFGGGNAAEAFGVAVDLIGNVYVTGFSNATFGSPVNAFSAGIDIFAAKLDSNGNLIWNTFLGGTTNLETGQAVAVDASSNVYLVGYSPASWGTPVRPFSGGTRDAFAAKLDPNGTLIWNTFLGGSGTDNGNGLAVDISGNVYVGGNSNAAWDSPVRAFSGNLAGFVAKLDPNGILTWNTFLGGSDQSSCGGLASDVSGNVYVAGLSNSSWGSPVRAYTGDYDAFAAKLTSSGTLIWNTFLGGAATDAGNAVSLDAGGNVYIGGYSATTWGTPTNGFNGGLDVFAAKLDSTGALTWNTFVGGSQSDQCFGIAVDPSGNVGLSGFSNTTWGSPIRPFGGGSLDVFVAKVPVTSPTPTPTPTPGCQITTSIASSFNGTPISGGNYIWFSSVLKPSGLVSTPVTIRFTQQTITSANFMLSVPDASVTFDPLATSATTTFSGGMWVTHVPSSGLAGNTFFSGLSYQVPANLPGGISNVTWSGTVSIDTPGVSLNWKWAAAVYTSFSSDYNALGVKPVDDGMASQYHNSDHAGTPENFKPFVTGGAKGSGGSNYTGGLSGTASVGPCP